MLLAADSVNRTLIVGLMAENVERLLNDEPIRKPLDEVPGLEGWTLVVLGPEDLERFVARFGPDGVER